MNEWVSWTKFSEVFAFSRSVFLKPPFFETSRCSFIFQDVYIALAVLTFYVVLYSCFCVSIFYRFPFFTASFLPLYCLFMVGPPALILTSLSGSPTKITSSGRYLIFEKRNCSRCGATCCGRPFYTLTQGSSLLWSAW